MTGVSIAGGGRMRSNAPVASRVAAVLAAILLAPATAGAQTANGSPTAPASPGLVGTPRPISRTAPSVGPRRSGGAAPAVGAPLPKPTAAERAEKRKLDRDLKICIGC